VIVATLRALKYHGGVDLKELERPNLQALREGTQNLRRHVSNLKASLDFPAWWHSTALIRTQKPKSLPLQELMEQEGVQVIPTRHWAQGSAGATELAQKLIQLVESQGSPARLLYEDQLPLWNKIETIATRIYGASRVEATPKIRAQLEQLEEAGFGHYPVCIAKTQVSFSVDPTKRGAPTGHSLTVREIRLAAGAEFIIAICGDILTMPGLPKNPAAMKIDLLSNGQVTGLS
jgi:formate--tetrahydrofolate ligase